jgi:hypothetical protein
MKKTEREEFAMFSFDAYEELEPDQPINYKPLLATLKDIYYDHRRAPMMRKYCKECDKKFPCRTRVLIESSFWWSK